MWSNLGYTVTLCTLTTKPACKNPPKGHYSFCCMEATRLPTALQMDCEELCKEIDLETYNKWTEAWNLANTDVRTKASSMTRIQSH